MITSVAARPLAESLRELYSEAVKSARRLGQPVLASWTLAAPHELDPLQIFALGAGLHRFRIFWEQGAAGAAFAGLGAALTIQTDGSTRFRDAAALAEQARSTAIVEGDALDGAVFGPVLLGGFAFDPARPAEPHWRHYPAGLLILPRILWARRDGLATITISAQLQPDDDPETAAALALRDLDMLDASTTGFAELRSAHRAVEWTERPPAVDWKAAVAAAAADVRAGRFEKVVLAREVRVCASAPLRPEDVLDRLRLANPRAMVFAFGVGDQCFLGATPELLVRLSQRTVTAHCLAGSIARGASEDEAAELAQRLLASAKDRVEHEIVAQSTEAALRAVCDEVVRAPETPYVVRSGSVQHLLTPLTGRVRNGKGLLELLDVLHPTPAVGGFPREVAMEAIREREGLDRGWYAGPVGWMDFDGDGEFAVAIRSALLTGEEAFLYAGCGIVADSEPEAEYQETCLKLKPMLAALNLQ